MKNPRVVALQMEEQKQTVSEVDRKLNLILAHLGIDPEAPADEGEAGAAPAESSGPVPTKEEAPTAQAGAAPADSAPPTEAEEVEAEKKAGAEGRTHQRRR